MSIAGYVKPFRVLSRSERARFRDEYGAHLRRTDGEVDFAARTLSLREQRMRSIESWQPAKCAAASPSRAIAARRAEWLLAATKANEGEGYGVEIELGRYAARGGFPGFESPDLMLRVLMQEHYHSRILAELCRSAGVQFEPSRPAWPTRWFLAVIGAVPPTLRWAIVLAGECVGASLFRRLHDALPGCDFVPEEQARLRSLIRAIWLDEVLHVSFLRASLGRAGLAVSRALLPVVAYGVFQQVPDLRALGCTPRRLLADLRVGIPIPSELEWLSVDEGFPDSEGLAHATP